MRILARDMVWGIGGLYWLALLFIAWTPAEAFVSDSAVTELEELVEVTVASGGCPNVPRLAQLIGYCSLSSVDQECRDSIVAHFDLFYTAVALSQRPPYEPDYFNHTFFIEHSDELHQQSMIEALRAWLVDPGEEVQTGSLGISGPGVVTQASVKAAEYLADLGDPDLPRLVGEFKERYVLSEKERWWLDRAAKRAVEPCEESFYKESVNGHVVFCQPLRDFPDIVLQPGNHTHTEPGGYVLSESEKQKLLVLVAGATVGGTYRFGGEPYWFVIRFPDGLEVSLQPSHGGNGVLYSDNGTSSYRPDVALQSKELFEWSYELIQAHR